MHNNMKLITRLCLAAGLATFLAGCASKQEVAPNLTFPGSSAGIISSGISAPATETMVELDIQSTRSWTAIAEDSSGQHAGWIVVFPASGEAGDDTITILLTANPNMESRSGIITISSVDLSETIQVRQEGRAPYPVTEVLMSEAEVELQVGETYTLLATVFPTFADGDKTVTWTSSKPEVATVSNGKVTAKAVGTTQVKAAVGALSATCTVTVKEQGQGTVAVESVTLSLSVLTLKEGESYTLTAVVLPENADDKTVVWTTSDSQVATVSNGVVKAVKAGMAVITATAGEKSATCTVTVEASSVPQDGSGGEDLGGEIDVDPWN